MRGCRRPALPAEPLVVATVGRPAMSRPWQALRALRLRLLGPAKELVGTDQFGNKYYRMPKHETRAGQFFSKDPAGNGSSRILFSPPPLPKEEESQ